MQTTFGALIKAAVEGSNPGVHNDVYEPNAHGAVIHIPTEQHAIIPTAGVGGRVSAPGTVEFLSGDGDSPVLDRVRFITTDQTRGKMALGEALPAAHMTSEFGALAATTEPVLGDADYVLDKVIEVASEVTTWAIQQAGDEQLDQIILDSHRIAVRDMLLLQILNGDGMGNNVLGVGNTAGIGQFEYAMAERASDTYFTVGEAAVEDAGGRRGNMAWAFGTDLSSSARTIAIDPGSSRRVEENGRLTLSNTPTQRVGSPFPTTTGVLADWRTILVPMLSTAMLVIDRVTNPGKVRLTTRLPIGNPIVSHPSTVYKLVQA